jgi:hypothetical protein
MRWPLVQFATPSGFSHQFSVLQSDCGILFGQDRDRLGKLMASFLGQCSSFAAVKKQRRSTQQVVKNGLLEVTRKKEPV